MCKLLKVLLMKWFSLLSDDMVLYSQECSENIQLHSCQCTATVTTKDYRKIGKNN